MEKKGEFEDKGKDEDEDKEEEEGKKNQQRTRGGRQLSKPKHDRGTEKGAGEKENWQGQDEEKNEDEDEEEKMKQKARDRRQLYKGGKREDWEENGVEGERGGEEKWKYENRWVKSCEEKSE